jgi:hypothetical protein
MLEASLFVCMSKSHFRPMTPVYCHPTHLVRKCDQPRSLKIIARIRETEYRGFPDAAIGAGGNAIHWSKAQIPRNKGLHMQIVNGDNDMDSPTWYSHQTVELSGPAVFRSFELPIVA